MYNVIANAVLLTTYAVIVLLVVQRYLEAKGMRYSIKRIENGRIFSFSLGVYGGKIRILHSPDCTDPIFKRRYDGWEVTFPEHFTEEQMDHYIMHHEPFGEHNASHSKDFVVFREVMIRKNNEVSCVDGNIFCQA